MNASTDKTQKKQYPYSFCELYSIDNVNMRPFIWTLSMQKCLVCHIGLSLSYLNSIPDAFTW